MIIGEEERAALRLKDKMKYSAMTFKVQPPQVDS